MKLVCAIRPYVMTAPGFVGVLTSEETQRVLDAAEGFVSWSGRGVQGAVGRYRRTRRGRVRRARTC